MNTRPPRFDRAVLEALDEWRKALLVERHAERDVLHGQILAPVVRDQLRDRLELAKTKRKRAAIAFIVALEASLDE